MGVESFNWQPEAKESPRFSLEEIFADRKKYNEFQALGLMPIAYSLRHPTEALPENKNVVALEWITEGDAKKLEDYIRLHPNEEIDITDQEELTTFLFRVDPSLREPPATIH